MLTRFDFVLQAHGQTNPYYVELHIVNDHAEVSITWESKILMCVYERILITVSILRKSRENCCSSHCTHQCS